MWHIEVWSKTLHKWVEVGTDEDSTFVEEGIQSLAVVHHTARAWRESGEGWTGMQASLYRGFCRWTGSGGLVRCI